MTKIKQAAETLSELLFTELTLEKEGDKETFDEWQEIRDSIEELLARTRKNTK